MMADEPTPVVAETPAAVPEIDPGIDELFSSAEAGPEVSESDAAAAVVAAPLPAVGPVEEFDVDGRKVTKEALFQTHRQFQNLQQTHLQVKPYLDFMNRLQ